MPPISQPGSRTGLITGIVVAVIAAVTALIFAIYFGVQAGKYQKQVEGRDKEYGAYVTRSLFTSEDVDNLRSMREADQAVSKTTPLLQYALEKNKAMAAAIGAGAGDAVNAGTKAVADAGARLAEANVPVSGSLTSAVETLTTAVLDRERQIAQLNDQLVEARRQADAAEQRVKANADANSQALAAAAAERQQAETSLASYKGEKDTSVQEIEAGMEVERQRFIDQDQQKQGQIVELQARTKALEDDLRQTRARISRSTGTGDSIVRQPDGRIIRLPGGNICYIDLGQGDQISPGITFEVYDKAEGIPANPTAMDDESVPQGKASIEVIRVGATSSECRIVRQPRGTQITEGDIIANLVYDRNTKFNFHVFGAFDMDFNGVATPGDADIIKRLISQWGGRVIDRANVDTDFVILGKEPELPVFTTEELEDPINRKKYDDAQVALNEYQDVVNKALALNIPIMNQNRFLYYSGYFEQAQR